MSAEWFDWMGQPEAWVALATLLGLEVVLGIDNVTFIAIQADKLPPQGFEQHIPKGYLYFAMAFSAFVELLNVRLRGRQTAAGPVRLHEPYRDTAVAEAESPRKT